MNRFIGPFLLGLLLGIVVGGGASIILSSSPEPDGTEFEAKAIERSSSVRRESASASDADMPEASAPASVSATQTDLPRVAREAITEASSPVVSAGNGVIFGQVLDLDGAPVAGVTVKASAIRTDDRVSSRKADGPPQEETLEERLRKVVEDHYRAKAENAQAISESDGRYTISSLADGDYSLRAYLKGHEVRSSSGNSSRARAGDEVNFTATAFVPVPVTVFLPDGSQAREASIECQRKSGQRATSSSERWTSSDPMVLLTPGSYELRATMGRAQDRTLGDDELASDPQSVQLVSHTSQEPLTFRLRGRPGVRGLVKFSPEEEVDQVTVRLLQVPSGEEPDPKRLGSEGERAWVRPERPEFVFRDIKPGTYALGLARG
jgi:hypothetical protein